MPDAAFFRPELFDVLRQLKRHNEREWFAKNKARYEEAIQSPALLFISSFAEHLQRLAPHFVADPRPTHGSLFRIYRDSRFSPDKRPFNTHVGIRFSHASGKDAHAPVFYLHLEAGPLLRGGGRLASRQPCPDENPNGDCRRARAMGEGQAEAGA
jgi:uncharacterized protein (TIGR02453 family)